MAVVKRAVPFNETLKTAVIPKIWEVNHSLTGYGTCPFTVINFRDQTTHIVEVSVDRVKKQLYSSEGSSYGWNKFLEMDGRIVKLDGKEWGPPADRFEAIYLEDKPESSSFKFLRA